MNLFVQSAVQSISAIVATKPEINAKPTAKCACTWRADCKFVVDGSEYTVTAWHNHASQPKLNVGDTVTLTAQLVDGRTFINLPRDCHV